MKSRLTVGGVVVFFLITLSLKAQQTIISGKVTDAQTGDPVPFANIVLGGTSIGATTDFAGHYEISTIAQVDSIVASYIGYQTKAKAITFGKSRVINFQLQEEIMSLEDVIFYAGENPAFAIMRKAAANRTLHNKKSLQAYEFESYNKIEVDLDNLTEKFRKRKLMQKIKKVIDSVDQIAGEDGQAVLPIFISESISKFYFRNNPELQKEHILKTKITGVGMDDGSLISQFIGSSFQEYNFYQNWLNIWDKEFISPIADGWKGYYDVYLIDSLYIGGHFCYRIDITPKREGDLAFSGTIWITKQHYALKQVDLRVTGTANLNFVEKIKIQQELEPTNVGPWIPVKSRVLTDFSLMADFGFSKQAAGFLTKFYTSNKDWVINQPHNPRFYYLTIEVEEDAMQMDEDYWDEIRHDPLTPTEKNVITMIDTLREIPSVRRLTDVITYLASGFIEIGKLDVGPYPLIYANNNIEGHRFRLGGRTNIYFSKKWVLKGYLAYGTQDEEFKYGAGVDYIVSRKPWTKIGFYSNRDIQQVGLTYEDRTNLFSLVAFEAFFRNRKHTSPYLLDENRLSFRRELRKGLNQRIIFRQREFSQLPLDPDSSFISPILTNFSTTEIVLETRYGKDELWIQNDNVRTSFGSIKYPIYTFRLIAGIDNLLGSDLSYQHASINIFKNVKMGFLGVSSFSLTGGKVFGEVPVPLLKGHIGNESPFLVRIAYNLMNSSEFVSDTYASLNYRHRFEGFILNRMPLIKKLKWRLRGTANVLFGGVTDENEQIISDIEVSGNPGQTTKALDSTPYVELGYGFENIFKFGRVDFFHRLTYLNDPNVDKFGVKFSFQIIF